MVKYLSVIIGVLSFFCDFCLGFTFWYMERLLVSFSQNLGNVASI